jgi:hypothetical protein
MKHKTISFDTEYNENRVVCACTRDSEEDQPRRWWLLDPKQIEELKSYLELHRKDRVLIAHAVEKAEGQFMCRIGLDPARWEWFDTMIVELIIQNCNNILLGNEVKKLKKGLEGHGLVDLEYKYLNKIDRSEHKRDMRDLILSDKNLEENREAILDYCCEDIDSLRAIADKQIEYYTYAADQPNLVQCISLKTLEVVTPPSFEDAFIGYSHYIALYSKITFRGMPADGRYSRLIKNANRITADLRKSFNEVMRAQYGFKGEVFTEVTKKTKGVKKTWMKEDKVAHRQLIKIVEKKIREEVPDFSWPISPKGDYKTDSDTLSDVAIKKTIYRRSLKQIRDFDSMLKFAKNMNISEDWDETKPIILHPSGVPDLTQTFRNAPRPSKGFLPVQSHEGRAMVNPREAGYSLVGVDFKAEENCIAADVSGEDKMRKAYESPDYYCYVAKELGMMPQEATKKTHPIEREQAKIFCLMNNYGAGPKLLAHHLSVSLEEAKELQRKFNEKFPDYFNYRDRLNELTTTNNPGCVILLLPDNMPYMCWSTDHTGGREALFQRYGLMNSEGRVVAKIKKSTSIGNLPIQGSGTSVLRAIVEQLDYEGFDIIYTLHDEVVCNVPENEKEAAASRMMELFKECYQKFFPGSPIRTGEPDYRNFNDKIIAHEVQDNENFTRLIDIGMFTPDEIQLA